MSNKKPNRLAHIVDHQSFAGSALPQNLSNDFARYTQATTEVKTLLVDCLPEEILNTCWVVGLTNEQLTLSVASHTAANHIRYLQKAYLSVLSEQSITFKQLKQINVMVTTHSSHYANLSAQLLPAINTSNPSKAPTNKVLSQNTKWTISQALEHVITDKNLQKALLRLIKN